MLKKLNKQIQYYSDKEYSFITGNGTSAIYLALKTSSIPKGSKIAVPNISCPDPVYALIWAGYKPVFIDVNINDYNMNTNSLESFLENDKEIKAIIAIHLFGNACDIVYIKQLAQKYNCFLLEDCAQSFGNEIDEGKLGSFGDVSIFSFGSGKILEVGHGGSIQSDDRDIIETIKKEHKKFNSYNEIKIEKLSKLHRKIYYKLYYLGIKYPKLNILNLVYIYFFKNYYLYQFDEKYLMDIRNSLDSLEKNKQERLNIIKFYIDNLQNNKYIKLPTLNNQENILSRLTIQIDEAEVISKRIRDNNIPANTMYPMLVDRFKLFFEKDEYINSFKLKEKLLNLWTNNIDIGQLKETIKILQRRKI